MSVDDYIISTQLAMAMITSSLMRRITPLGRCRFKSTMPQMDIPALDFVPELQQQQHQVPVPSYPQPLMDRFGRVHNYLRISLTERCNFRCTYCMPPEGVELTPTPSLPTLTERKEILRTFIEDYNVDKLRFTGGEPTVSKELLPLIQYATSLRPEMHIGMTTNGLLLHRQIDNLVVAGLNSVNISLDSLDKDKFAKISRRPANNLNRVLENIDSVVDRYGRPSNDGKERRGRGESGPRRVHVKLNIVLIKGVNDDEILDFVNLSQRRPIDVRFIELMPFDGNGWDKQSCLGYREVLEVLQYGHGMKVVDAGRDEGDSSTGSSNAIGNKSADMSISHSLHHKSNTTNANSDNSNKSENGDNANDTTKWFKIEGYEGRIGFITTMTKPFCKSCNRLRVTADGKMKNCLFGSGEMDLLKAMRTPSLEPPPVEGTEGEGLFNSGESESSSSSSVNRVLLRDYIQQSVHDKHYQLGGHGSPQDLVKSSNRSMIKIGG